MQNEYTKLNQFFLVLAVFICCKIFCRVPLSMVVTDMIKNFRKSYNVIKSKQISDHWKEVMLPYYSIKGGIASLIFLFLLILVASPIILLLIIDNIFDMHFYTLLSSFQGGVISTIAAISYFFLRTKFTHGL